MQYTQLDHFQLKRKRFKLCNSDFRKTVFLPVSFKLEQASKIQPLEHKENKYTENQRPSASHFAHHTASDVRMAIQH